MELSTWGGLLTFAGTAGIITALLNQVFGIIRDGLANRHQRKREGGYHALRLAALLEGYAYDCANFISDNGNAQHFPEEEFPNWNVSLPELPAYPEEADGWHALDLKLAGRALDLRNHIAGSRGIIRATIDFVEQELGDELDEQAALRGKEAWQLAVDFRRRYGLPAFEPVWDFTGTLESALTSARAGKESRRQQQAKMMKGFPQLPPDEPV